MRCLHPFEILVVAMHTKGASLEEVRAAVGRLWHKPQRRSLIY